MARWFWKKDRIRARIEQTSKGWGRDFKD
uniref:Uncharacterized protein n=1 Tax=Rhizophora mucronata TaxID=61149 RepID=A0A2P2PU74_RHIMU